MAARRSLFRYYSEQRWAEAFLDGRMRFQSLNYFRDLEAQGVRGDAHEGTSVCAPGDGLQVTNQTQGTRFTLPAHALVSRARCDEIFVFCASRVLSARLWDAFDAQACIEITDVPAFCSRVNSALPPGAKSPGRPGRERLAWRVEYYSPTDAPDTRWALPDRIAYSKQAPFAWQEETRLVFSTTGALDFQNVALTIEQPPTATNAAAGEPPFCDIGARCVRDICRLHATRPEPRLGPAA